MKRRTNILLDVELVSEAASLLGTQRTTDTVHAALREVVALERRKRLAKRDLPGLTLRSIETARRRRTR